MDAHGGATGSLPTVTGDGVRSVRPIWLLDVDGVLNATKPGWGAAPKRGWARYGDSEYRIRWAPELIRNLSLLHSTGMVDIRWASSWNEAISQIEDMLNTPRLALAYTPPVVPHGVRPTDVHGPLKLATALSVVRDGKPLIWTDDDAIPTAGPEREELEAAGALLIAPDPRRGIQRPQWDAIAAFVMGTE